MPVPECMLFVIENNTCINTECGKHHAHWLHSLSSKITFFYQNNTLLSTENVKNIRVFAEISLDINIQPLIQDI